MFTLYTFYAIFFNRRAKLSSFNLKGGNIHMADKKTISILGAGAMGWAIAWLISTYQRGKVKLWDRDSSLIAEAQKIRINTKYSNPEIKLSEDVFLSNNLKEVLKDSNLVLLAVPSYAVREMCQKISSFSLPPILMISKGMEKESSLLPFQIVEEVLGKKDILHLTGTGYGKEVHKKIPTIEALASKDENLLKEVKNLFKTDWLTIITSTDLLGTQLAGALKNVMVIGIGMVIGSEENPELKNKLIKESILEMTSLGKVMGAKEETFLGPAGKGDLELSADPLSRNYKLGQALAEKGLTKIEKDLKEKGITVEGFYTAWAVNQLTKKYGLILPIIEEVYGIIYKGKTPKLSSEKLRKLAEQP